MTRRIPLEGIANFRDFGGYRAGDRTVKTGLLYRSANHAEASEADLSHLSSLGLAAVVDLRRPSERERGPSRRWAAFSATLIEGDDEFEGPSFNDFIHTSDHSAGATRAYMTAFYKAAPLVPRHVELFSRYFAALSETDGAVLVHCVAGKDRTGILCALTHALAGVHEDDMMADFLATNDPARVAHIGPLWAKDIAAQCGREPPLESIAVAMSVEPEYLCGAFSAVTEQYGSVDGYLERALGVDSARRAAIEARILS